MESAEALPAVAAEVSSEASTTPIVLTEADKSLLDSLTVIEKLLISQSVFEFGNGDFKSVAKVLQGHALLKSRTKHYFNPDKCSKVFNSLMTEMGVDASTPQPPNSAPLLKLARKYYMERVMELRNAMQLEQDRFRIQFSEIQQIKDGQLDHLLDPSLGSSSNPTNSNSTPVPATSSSSSSQSVLPPLPSASNSAPTSTLEPTPKAPSVSHKKGASGRGKPRGRKGGRGGRGKASVAVVEEGAEEVKSVEFQAMEVENEVKQEELVVDPGVGEEKEKQSEQSEDVEMSGTVEKER